MYTEEAILEIKRKYDEISSIRVELTIKIGEFSLKLKNEKSREYLMAGVNRRLNVLARCIENIFEIFPVDRSELLARDELTDLDINLHAFFVNVSGILDNLAWVFVCENELLGKSKEGKLTKNNIGLFKEET